MTELPQNRLRDFLGMPKKNVAQLRRWTSPICSTHRLLPILEGDFRAAIQGNSNNGLEIVSESGDPAMKDFEGSHLELCASVKNILLFDSEGCLVAVEYYSDDWPTNSVKEAFKKSLFTKTQKKLHEQKVWRLYTEENLKILVDYCDKMK
ncbi:coatomer subunit zeta-1-like protein [Tanacetum coccineum]